MDIAPNKALSLCLSVSLCLSLSLSLSVCLSLSLWRADEDAVKVRGLVGKLTNVGMKLLVKLFLTIVNIPIIKEHDKDS
jgi:hypothetical protein